MAKAAPRKYTLLDGRHLSLAGLDARARALAADLIGISRAAVYKAIEKGAIRTRRIGNVTIIDRKSAVEYRERRTSGEPPEAAKRASGTRTAEDSRASA